MELELEKLEAEKNDALSKAGGRRGSDRANPPPGRQREADESLPSLFKAATDTMKKHEAVHPQRLAERVKAMPSITHLLKRFSKNSGWRKPITFSALAAQDD